MRHPLHEAVRFLEALRRLTRWNLKRPLIPAVPQPLRAAYRAERLRRFRGQMILAVNLVLIALVAQRALAAIFPRVFVDIPPGEFYGAIGAVLFFLLLSRHTGSLRFLQLLSAAVFAVPTAFLVRHAQPTVAHFLVVLFLVGTLFSWNGLEAVVVSGVWVLLSFALVPPGDAPEERIESAGFFFLSSLIVTSLQLSRERDRRISFVLECEQEEAEREILEGVRLAARLHEDLITRSLDAPGLAARVHYEPVQHLGGDYVKIVAGDDGRARMFLADVTGHGAAAALLVNRIDAWVEALAEAGLPPEAACRELRAFAVKHFAGTGLLMTGLWAEHDPAARRLRWSNHGHPPPVLLRPGETPRLLREGATTPMGADIPYRVVYAEAEVRPGDLVVFYTDGLIEAEVEDGPFDLAALEAELSRWTKEAGGGAEALLSHLLASVRARKRREPRDDLLLVVWEILPADLAGKTATAVS